MRFYKNLVNKVFIYMLLSSVSILIISGCAEKSLNCPVADPDELFYPTASTGWILSGHIWQDNDHILYQDAKGQFYIVSLGGNTEQLDYINTPYDPPYTHLVGWSSSGLLALADNKQDVLQIIDLKNGYEREFSTKDRDPYHIVWSHNDSNLAIFGEGEREYTWDMSMNLDDATRVSRHQRGMLWSPDDTMIAYYVAVGDPHAGEGAHLRVKNSDTGKTIYSVPEGACQGRYSWSPDSKEITFDARLEGGSDIYMATINSDDAPSVNLTKTSDIHEYDPKWSPKGDAIVFVGVVGVFSYPDSIGQSLYLLKTQTGEIIQLTGSKLDELNPVWSPDGEHIAFMSTDGIAWNLEVMNVDGSEREILASWK